MKNSSKTWLLGSILLLPGVFIALTMQVFGPGLMTSDEHQSIRVLSALPATSAGDTTLAGFPADDWGLKESLITRTVPIRDEELTGSLTLQVLKYRFRRSEPVEARMQFVVDSGSAPRGAHMSLALTTRQGNYVADISPEWHEDGESLFGKVSVVPEAGWPDGLNLVLTLKAPERLPVESSVEIELFSPKVLIKSVGQAYSDGDEWVIPVEAEIHEPGVMVVSARLTEDNGSLITHLHSRGHFEKDGILEIRLRKQLIEESHYHQNLLMTDISVHHIADSLNADMGWGASERDTFVLPPISDSASE